MKENKEIMAEARSDIRENFGKCIAATFVFVVLTAIYYYSDFFSFFASYLVLGEESENAESIGILGSLLIKLVLAVISFGFSAFFLALTEHSVVGIGRLFIGYTSFKTFLKTLWLGIVENFLLFLWSLLLIVPGIMKWYSFSMSYFVRLDNPDLGAFGTLDESELLMHGNRLRLLKLQLRFIGYCLLALVIVWLLSEADFLALGIILSVLAVILILPYYYAAKAKFYLELKSEDHVEKAPAENPPAKSSGANKIADVSANDGPSGEARQNTVTSDK